MTQWQDSEHPTGVNSDRPHGGSGGPGLARARARKSDAAIQMRLAGASWNEIAVTLGYATPRQALVQTEKALNRQLSGTDREKLRQMAGARLERLLRSVWPKAVNPEDPEHLFAVGKARDIIDRHAKLFGLDAPTEIVVHSPTQAELDAWVSQVIALQSTEVTEYDIIEGELADEPPELEAQ